MKRSKRVLLFSAVFLFIIFAFPLRFYSQKTNLQIETKVENLLKQLTLDEKISLIAGIGFETIGVKRLGIPALNMTDGPAGIRIGPATSFPSGMALASTF